MAVLIGSLALHHRIPRFTRCNDYDIVMSADEYQERFGTKPDKHKIIIDKFDKIMECEFDDIESNKWLLSRKFDKQTIIHGLPCQIADIGTLLALKHSHRYYPQNWHKNIKDYHFLKSITTLTEELLNFSKLRESEKAKKQYKSIRSLNVDNNQFFESSQKMVGRIYNHDDLHYATCYYDAPIWTRCKKDQSKAYISEKLFNNLDQSDKIKMVQEEAFVIALERKIIPKNTDTQKAYAWAVMRIGTDLTTGWFRDFTIDNYHAIMKYDHDFVTAFKNNIKPRISQ